MWVFFLNKQTNKTEQPQHPLQYHPHQYTERPKVALIEPDLPNQQPCRKALWAPVEQVECGPAMHPGSGD